MLQSRAAATRRGGMLFPAVAVALLALTVYANTLKSGFVWDDASSILLHQHVKDPTKFAALFTEDQHAFAGGQGNFYRPLLSVTFMIDYAIARIGSPPIAPTETPKDLNPFVFHLSSALWHAAAAVLLLIYLIRIASPTSVALPVAAIYAVHPLHTEAVAYISGRADSLAAVFIFAGLNLAVRRGAASTGLMLVCFAAGLLSKEATFVFPPLLILSRMVTRPASGTSSARERVASWIPEIGSFVLIGVYFALRSTVLNFGSDTVPRATTFVQRLTETFQAFAIYLRLLFIPTGLHMERTLDGVAPWVAPVGAAACLGIIAVAFLCYRRGQRRTAFGLIWFLLAWLPISGLFPLNAPMAEHWMYVPMAGLFLGIAELIVAALRRDPALRVIAAAAVAGWLIFLSTLTVLRNRDWRNDETLYVATLRENPNSTRVHFNLGVVYQDILNNPAGARREFSTVANTYSERKRKNPAEKDLFWSDELEAHVSLGQLAAAEYRFGEAFGHYRVVLGVEPTGPNAVLVAEAAYGAGGCYLATGEPARAREYFEEAVRLAPQLKPEIDRVMPPPNAPTRENVPRNP